MTFSERLLYTTFGVGMTLCATASEPRPTCALP